MEIDMTTDSLRKLHTTLVDNRNGYETAVKDADTPELKALFTDMVALKETNHSELHDDLVKLGEQPDESGSFMSTVHQTVIDVRAAITGLGPGAISSFVTGEEQVVAQYDQALEDCAGDPAVTAKLTRQKQTLLAKIDQMKRLEA
jgi:uncharacterized protein (TIGR02284 family)